MAMATVGNGYEVDQTCLSLFTSNHANHDTLWIVRGSAFKIICIACLIETLENKEVLAIRKRKVLTELLLLLSRDEKLVEVLSMNMRVCSHLCVILGDLLEGNNEAVCEMAIEGLVQLACNLRSEIIVREMVDNIESKIFGLNNLRKSCSYIALIGKLVNMIAPLGEGLVIQKSKLLKYCISNLSFTEEKIRLSLLYLTLGVCQNKNAKSKLSSESSTVIFKSCCENLVDSKSKVISMNSLALLQSFTCSEDVKALGILVEEKEGKHKRALMGNALKKVILNTEESVQIGGIQCMTKFLKLDSEGILSRSLLQCGLAEFLFEALETNNDIVLASLFCCLTEFFNSTEFFKGSYSVYGIDSVISGMYKALKLQNPETIHQGLHVLSIIITKQPKGVQLFSNGTTFERCLNAVEECLNSMEYNVVQEAIKVMGDLLRVDQVPSGFNTGRMLQLLSAVVSLLNKFATKNVENVGGIQAATAQERLCSLLAVIKKAITFTNEYREKSPSLEEALLKDDSSSIQPSNRERSIQEVSAFLMRTIDESCITAVMINYETINNPSVFEVLFSLLNSQLSSPSHHHAKLFAKKLATTSFIKISIDISGKFIKGSVQKSLTQALQQFQRKLIVCLSDASEEKQVIEIVESTITPGSPDECLSLLTQSSVDLITSSVSDKMLFKTQCFCIELLYFAYIYQDLIIPEHLLLKGLHKFICLHSNLGLFPLITLRHLVFLYSSIVVKHKAVLSTRDFQNLIESQNILEGIILKFQPEEFHKISSYDGSFVLWVFGSDNLKKVFGKCLLEKMFADEKDQCPLSLWSSLKDNEIAVRSLLSLVFCENPQVVEKALGIIEKTLQRASQQEDSRTITQITTDELQKLFLRNQLTPLPEQVLMSMLKILLPLQAAAGSEVDIKLLYFVIDILTKPTDRILCTTVAAINYLNVALCLNLDAPQPRVAAVLFSNREFTSWLQKAMDSLTSQDPRKAGTEFVNVFAACLLLVSNLFLSQSRLRIVHTFQLTLPKDILIDLLNANQICLLQLVSLVFWKAFFILKGKSFVLFEKDRNEGQKSGIGNILTESDLRVILVYLQNCLLQESEAITSCSMTCLQAFLTYGENQDLYENNGWNTVILEFLLFSTGKRKLMSNLIQLCMMMLKCNNSNKMGQNLGQEMEQEIGQQEMGKGMEQEIGKGMEQEMEESVSQAVKAILHQIPNIKLDLDETGDLSDVIFRSIEFLKEILARNSPEFPTDIIDDLLAWCKSVQEMSNNNKKPKRCKFINVGHVLFTKDSVMGQVDNNTRFTKEVIQQLERKKAHYTSSK